MLRSGESGFRRISSDFCLAKTGCRWPNHAFFETFHTKRLCGVFLVETNLLAAMTPRWGRAFDTRSRSV
jgi:hypothetical protein